ncbi:ABC-type glycerol-3-phosphate transport system, substrate-binding protein [Sporobacter termitidis DSM 10068]|uniref:ABC-type glycerol-3-phosphate transport system, substrate-binding protein n=1 Tax=Sporobacter termitidis DSM 10068 TaxID=1123282 RepID=A0A1M5Z450_9FIRM|nr:ABC transporter substrate-binding protein [Sporobacter termitidis]SHI18904.1 ABC-type glycerol-3-phosphate transport system, substrate-binding protein [Sporobacter termitidis DSM 10068]
MLKRRAGLALCLLLPAFILSGCSSIPFLSGGNTTKERTLVFSHWDTENQEVYKALAEAYAEEHTGLTIEVQAVAPEGYADTYLKSVSDQKAPDVLAVPADDQFQRFVSSGKLMDLTKSKLLPEDYDSALAQIGSRDGHIWAVPATGSIPVVFFNKACYTQNKLVSPLTVSDFIVNCSILQQNGVTPFAMSTDGSGQYDTADFAEGILANGLRDTPLLSNGKFFDSNTELDSGFMDTAGLASALTASGLIAAKENSAQGHQALLEQFTKGAYAMIPGTTDDIKTLRALDGSFGFGFFPMPGSGTSAAGVFKADMMLGISKGTKLKSDAEGFISYLLSPSSQALICDKALSIPASNDVKLSDDDLAGAQALLNVSGEKRPSLFQRITSTEKSICLKKLDLAYSGPTDDLDGFMQDWASKLKALYDEKK